MIFTTITHALMASLAMFSTVFKLRKSAMVAFAQKKFLKDISNSEICYRYNSGSNRARNFKLASRFVLVQF